MTIVRVQKVATQYSTINNSGVIDDTLSWKAKGLLWYALTKPDGWNIHINDLIKRSSDGRDATRSALDELEEKCYLVRVRLRDERGLFDWNLIIFETPTAFNAWATQNPELFNESRKRVENRAKSKNDRKKKQPDNITQLSVSGSSLDGKSPYGFSVSGSSESGQPVSIDISNISQIDISHIEKENKEQFVDSAKPFPEPTDNPQVLSNPEDQETSPPTPSPLPPENIGKQYIDPMGDRFKQGVSRKARLKPLLDDDGFIQYMKAEIKSTEYYKSRKVTDGTVRDYMRAGLILTIEGENRFDSVLDKHKEYQKEIAAKSTTQQPVTASTFQRRGVPTPEDIARLQQIKQQFGAAS